MDNKDTICLLKECDAGSKMGVASIDDILEKVKDSKMKELLQESKNHHTKLGEEIHTMLNECHADEKDPSMMAKGMSHMKTSMKLAMDASDATIAALITDGCDMGIKSLTQYINEYENADKKAKDLCDKLISIEEKLRKDMKVYL